MFNLRRFLFSLWLVVFVGSSVSAQQWTKTELSFTVDSVKRLVNDNYVFPDVADKMTQHIVLKLKNGQYDRFPPADLARQLTEDLQAISNDKHLRVVYDPVVVAREKRAIAVESNPDSGDDRIEEMRRENFGFREVKVLEGNVGYLDLRSFVDPRFGSDTAIAVMRKLMATDAVIIDLRQNGGGSPTMIAFISSYFFSDIPVHLNTFYDRRSDATSETWTSATVEGTRRPDVDLYILISNYTFSAAEEFSYNMKALERATLVGEATKGGAHPTRSMIATNRFYVRVPTGRAVNPITQTNWEGVGVKPDVEVTADEALTTAHIQALEKLRNGSQDKKKITSYDKIIGVLKTPK
jgi:C-terminal processing protease CtpA/Prc